VGSFKGGKMKKYSYRMTGIIDGWQLIREDGIIARTDKEAKSKLRRRYPKIQSVHIRARTEIETKQVTITPQQRVQLKSQLAERTKIRRRKEDARRQHIYK
jgi:hypothetical protein